MIENFNSKVGSTLEDSHLRHVVGKYGLRKRNERGERLIANDVLIINTNFHHDKQGNTLGCHQPAEKKTKLNIL